MNRFFSRSFFLLFDRPSILVWSLTERKKKEDISAYMNSRSKSEQLIESDEWDVYLEFQIDTLWIHSVSKSFRTNRGCDTSWIKHFLDLSEYCKHAHDIYSNHYKHGQSIGNSYSLTAFFFHFLWCYNIHFSCWNCRRYRCRHLKDKQMFTFSIDDSHICINLT